MAQLLKLEQQISTAIADVDDIEALEEWRAQARALEGYLRDKELQGPMLAAQRRCEARIGQLLGPTTEGARTDLTVTHAEQLGRRADRSDFRLLAHALDGGVLVGNEWRECKLEFEEWRKSRRALIAIVRQRLGLVEELAPLPKGIFRCIVADPPWQLDTGPDAWGTTGERGHDALAYEQISVERIMEMPVAKSVAADAHLYLWTTNRYVESAYAVARAWGFKPSVLLVWAKTPHGIGLGDAFRLTTEFVLYARRGNLKEKQISPTTWFNWPRSIHSRKPEEFYQLVESMTPAPHAARDRLELFARRRRVGWTVWGNEVGGDIIEADHEPAAV